MRSIVMVLALTVAACAEQRPPQIAYDDPGATAVAAHLEVDPPKPVEIVELPKPLPLPGQLKLAPAASGAAADRRPQVARVGAANQAARQEPAGDGFIDAVQVWPYHPGALYQLYTQVGQVTDIALEPGEELSDDPAGGDTERWELGSATSGAGDAKQVHLFVKPKRTGLNTNLVIPTNRRIYHVEMHSTPATYLAAVSWTYPLDLKWKLERRNAEARRQADTVVDDQIDLQHLHHRYAITGDAVPWKPVDAWDDERKVYFQMPHGLAQGDAPPLFILGPKGDAELVNYRVRGTWYVVDRLFAAAELRLGSDPQQVVRISRTDGTGRG